VLTRNTYQRVFHFDFFAFRPHGRPFETSVKEAIQDYFDSLAKSWAVQDNLVVRVSQIETKVLNVECVIDITGT